MPDRAPGVVGLSPEELEGLLESGAILLVDVREKAEHARGSIAGSRLAPLSSLPVEQLAEEAPRLVLYCHAGGRSANAAARISACAGVSVRHLEGGLLAWSASGKPVARCGGGSSGD